MRNGNSGYEIDLTFDTLVSQFRLTQRHFSTKLHADKTQFRGVQATDIKRFGPATLKSQFEAAICC